MATAKTSSIPMTSQALALSVVAELAAAATTPAFSGPITHSVGDISTNNNNGKVQRFVQKIWKIVNSKSDLVGWSADGSRVVVNRPKDFAKQILPRYFNTSNMSSFTRQLHFHGFKKTPTAKRSRPENWECQHDFFVRGHPEWLVRITRKRCNMQMASQEETAQLRKEIEELRETVAMQQKQMQSMAAMMLALHSEHHSAHSDRKRKASVDTSAHLRRPKQEPRIELDPLSGGHDLFEPSQQQYPLYTCEDPADPFGLSLNDSTDPLLGELEDLTKGIYL